jgi:REP element-mobilizing transposase RayT
VRRRDSLRLASYDYALPGAYFFTACIAGRACLLGSVVDDRMVLNAFGDAVRRCWDELPHHVPGTGLDAFVVMPNHVHGIILHDPPLHLGIAIGLFKSASGRMFNEVRRTPGERVWQRGYFEHVIRNDAELTDLRRYVTENPLRWALDRENVGAGHDPPLHPGP